MKKKLFVVIVTSMSVILNSCNKEDLAPALPDSCNDQFQYLQTYTAYPEAAQTYPLRSESDVFPFKTPALTIDYVVPFPGFANPSVLSSQLIPVLGSNSHDFCSQGTGKVRINSFLIYNKECRAEKDSDDYDIVIHPWEGAILTTDKQTLINSTGYQKLADSTGVIFEQTCLDYSFTANTINANGSYQLPLEIKVAPACTFQLFETDNVTPFIPHSNISVRINIATNTWLHTDKLNLTQMAGNPRELTFELPSEHFDIPCN